MMIKRVWLIVLVATAALALLVTPAAAVPLDDLTALAAQMPANIGVFGAVRIDDGYIETIDGLIGRLAQVLPAQLPPTNLSEQLDDLSKDFGGDFQTVFRAWLGDTAAVGIDYGALLDVNRFEEAFLLAIAITDAAAAEAYFDTLIERGDFSADKTSGSGFVTYSTANGMDVQINDAAILFGNLMLANNRMARLNSADLFNNALASLPQDDYNALLYLNYEAVLADVAGRPGVDVNPALLEDAFASIGGFAVGFTILDARSLVMDFAVGFELAAVGDLYGVDEMAALLQNPVDLTFARFIPADVPLLLQDNDLASAYALLVQQLAVLGNLSGGFDEVEPERIVEQVDFVVRGATGLTLDELIGWMSGDYAVWMSLSDEAAAAENLFGLLTAFPVDFGILIDATPDPAAAAEAAAGIGRALEFAADMTSGSTTSITLSNDTIGAVPVTVVTIEDEALPFPIEVVIGSSDTLLVIGTRRAAEAAFLPGASLLDDPRYQEAVAYLLPDTYTLAYLSGVPFLPLVTAFEPQLGRDADAVRAVLSLFNSSSISAVFDETISSGRAVITLPE